MSRASSRLVQLMCLVAARAVTTEEMSPGAVWARCGLCSAHGSGVSASDASQRLRHQASCPYPELQELEKEADREAA